MHVRRYPRSDEGVFEVVQAVGFVGAGQMGEPMVHRLLGAGFAVTVYARRPDVRQRLREQGAALVDSPAELAIARGPLDLT